MFSCTGKQRSKHLDFFFMRSHWLAAVYFLWSLGLVLVPVHESRAKLWLSTTCIHFLPLQWWMRFDSLFLAFSLLGNVRKIWHEKNREAWHAAQASVSFISLRRFHATPNWLKRLLKEARGLSIRKRRQRPYHVFLKQKFVMWTENHHLMRFWCGNALFKSLRRYVDGTLVCTWFVSL